MRDGSYVVIQSAMTVDGKIASRIGYSQLSCPYDLERLHRLRAESDGIMVGANTIIIDDPSLRVKYVEGKNPTRIIVDGRLRTPLASRVYTLKTAKTIVLSSSFAPQEKVEALRNMGVEVIEFKEGPIINIREALDELRKRGIRKIMVEGGGELLWYLFKCRVVDELRVTISPYIFGGTSAVSLVMGKGFSDKEEATKLKLDEFIRCRCKNEIYLRYRVMK